MKKIIIMLLLFISFDVMATSGNISEKNVFECNGKYYGSHGSPLHFHEVIKKNGKWVISGEETEIPSCYIKPVNKQEEVLFAKCVDGDTARFIINGQEEIVRFLAIDAPEVSHGDVSADPFGEKSSNYTCNKLKNAKKIVLEYDANSSETDKYGRKLAFVFTDGLLLQSELIKNGLAKVAYIYGDYIYYEDLKKDEELAKKQQIGVWSNNSDINENMGDINENTHNEETEDKENSLFDYLKKIFEYIVKIFDLLLN